jgi:tRNA modification GTPase
MIAKNTFIAISCLTGEGIGQFVDAIANCAWQSTCRRSGACRHKRAAPSCLERARLCLKEAEEELQKQADPELVAVPLREAFEAAGEIVGAADIEEILGKIFSTFCIGK